MFPATGQHGAERAGLDRFGEDFIKFIKTGKCGRAKIQHVGLFSAALQNWKKRSAPCCLVHSRAVFDVSI